MKLRTLLTLLLILLILRKMKRKKYHQKLLRKRLNRILLKADGKIYSPFETSAQIIFVPEALRTSRTRVSGASMPRTTPSTLSSTTRCSWCTSSSAGRRRSSTGSASPTRWTPSDSGDALLSTAHIYSELRKKSEKRGNWPETFSSPVQWRIWSNSDQPHNSV